MTKSNNTTEVRWQCVYCGAQCGVVKKQSIPPAQLAALPPWEPDRQTEWYRARGELRQGRQEAREALRQQLLNGKRAEWRQWYENYLASPEWREKRLLVLARASRLCEGCRLAVASEVHHTTYDHVGDELLFELVALCEECHQRTHGYPDRPPFDEG
jgi:5-methylcytosine-specific restriction endonuclease McrA